MGMTFLDLTEACLLRDKPYPNTAAMPPKKTLAEAAGLKSRLQHIGSWQDNSES